MIRKIFKILLLCILPFYLLVMFFIFANKVDGEVCKGVAIEIKDSAEAPFLKKNDVIRSLKKIHFNPEGKNLKEINTLSIREELEKNPIIQRANCYKTPEGLLKIDIYQRYPILRILGLSGNYYVDKEGVVMPVNYNFSAYVPVASGYISKEYATSDLLKFAVFLQDNKFWDAQIDQIYVTADGDVELIPRVGKQTIILGTLSDFEKKLDNLYAFYQKGQNKKGWNVYQAISLKYENQIIGIK